jgi:hypothetical protein
MSNGTFFYGNTIYGGSYDGILFAANITDNVEYSYGTHKAKDGNLAFTIRNSCSSCSITAIWKVSKTLGMKSTNEPEEFTIPTDIILTKVN